MKRQFKHVDDNDDGVITKKELQTMLKEAGHKGSAKEVREVMKYADKDGDGKLDFEEFKEAVKVVQ